MKILAIIPARGGSKGIPRKNIKNLGGKPLIAYSIERAMESNMLHTIMVSTDDEEIAKVANRYGLPVPFMRPLELALDSTPSIDVVVDVLERYKKQKISFDSVMLLEPTNPFRDRNEINECIDIFRKQKADSLITVKEVPAQYNPHWVFEGNDDGLLHKAIDGPVIVRRQILPKTYARDGSVYITKTKVVLSQHSLFGDRIAFKLNNNPDHINIDTPIDWLEAERIIGYKKKLLIKVV